MFGQPITNQFWFGRWRIGPTMLFRDERVVLAADGDDAEAVANKAKIEATQSRISLIVQDVLIKERLSPPSGSAAVVGKRMHKMFADAVRLAHIPDVACEQSFKGGRDADYGEAGSLRTDVLLRGFVKGEPRILAVWDYKTGVGATIPYGRIAALKRAISPDYGKDVEIIVLHTPLVIVEQP